MRIEKIDLKKKVMLALLAGNLLCMGQVWASSNTFNLNGAGELDLDSFDPATLSKSGNTIVFKIHENYGTPDLNPDHAGPQPLAGAFDDTGNEVTLSGHNVTVEIDSGKYVVQNISGGIAKNGTVTGMTLNVTGGNSMMDVIPDGSFSVTIDNHLGVVGGFVEQGSVKNNTVYIKNMERIFVAGGGYTTGDSSFVSGNTITVDNCTMPSGSYLIGGAATDFESVGGNVQNNKIIIKGNSDIQAEVYGGISQGNITNPLPAIGNGVEIESGTFAKSVYGVRTSADSQNNYVEISGGTFNRSIYGARTNNKSSATGNYVKITGGTFNIANGDIAGAICENTATDNYVEIQNGIINCTNRLTISGAMGDESVKNNYVYIHSGSFNLDNAASGITLQGASVSTGLITETITVIAENNSVTIDDCSAFGNLNNSQPSSIKGAYMDLNTEREIVNGGSLISNAIKNKVNINSGSFAKVNISGAEANVVWHINIDPAQKETWGDAITLTAKNNEININGGSFNEEDNEIIGARVYAGQENATQDNKPVQVTVENNIVKISNASFVVKGEWNNIIGGDGSGRCSISDYQTSGNAIATGNVTVDLKNNAVEFVNATFTGENSGSDKITIRGANGYADVYNPAPSPASVKKVNVENNKVTFTNSSFTGTNNFGIEIFGGSAAGATATNNSVIINSGNFTAAGTGEIRIKGGEADFKLTDNKVHILSGTFQGTAGNFIYGGFLQGVGELKNNQVILEGGIFNNTKIIAAQGQGESGNTSGNSITLKGSNALDLSSATLMGYETNGDNNRTLNVERTNVAVKDIKNFSTINFNLTSASSDANVLKMDGSFDVSTLDSVNINITNSPLTGNDYIVLMQNVTGTYSGGNPNIKVLGNDLIYYTGTAPATQKGDYTIKQDNGTKVWHETTVNGTYSYGTDIKGNVNKSPEGLVDTSYSSNEVIIRRGTYENNIYGVDYTGTDEKDMSFNSITVHGGTFHSASGLYYGRLCAVHTRGTGNFTGNVITINAGDFTNGDSASIYAVYGMNISGSSTNNSIVINGGNINTNKHIVAVYAGGTANGNTITINGGTIGSNINSPWLYIYGVDLYSGAGNTISGNEVNVNAGSFVGSMDIAGVSVGNYAGANTYSGNKVNISGGSFDLTYVTDGKINIYGIYRNGSVTAANNNSVIIANAQFNLDDANDEVNVYGASVGSGNVEHNSVELHDGKFYRVAGGMITGDGNANYNVLTIESGTFAGGYDIYAGYVGANGNVVGNKIIINGGDVGDSKEIDAGYINGDGDATGNIITISGGIIGGNNAVNIYGAEVKNGSATGNKVNITGGTFGKYVTIKGAILWQDNSDAEISGNEVNITGGTFDYKISIYGGHASSGTAKLVENNKVTIKNISVANESTIYGGNASATLVNGNGVTVENATFGNTVMVYGGNTSTKNAEGNFVTLKSSTFGDGTQIYGAYTDTGNAGGDTEDKGNKVIIDGGSFGDGSAIYGGYAGDSGNANYNKIVINAGTFNNNNIGNWSESGNSDKNTVIINDGNFVNYSSPNGIWSGLSNGSGSTNENKIYINGGTFGDNISFWGAYGSSGEAKDNIVEIAGGTFGNNFDLYGGYTGGTSTNNTLNLKIKMGGKASEVSHFQNMNFTLPSNITDGDIMLKTENLAVDGSGGEATINVNAAKGVKLKAGDVITLVDVGSTIADNFVAGDILGGAAELCVERDDAEDKNEDTDQLDLVITLLRDYGSGGDEDQQKAPVEGIAAAVQIVNQSADLASGEGMKSLIAETAGGVINTFGALTAGQSKYKTGSHVDVDGWGLLVGAGKTKEWGNGEATTLGVFFEYGKGDFDTYNGNVHGDGNSKNQGIGIMMRHKMLNNTYYEGNIRYGKQKTEWSESELGSYDTDSKYYGIMVGMGHIFPAGKNEIDVYGRYTFGHVGACDATVGDSHYNFESVKSHRVRVGGKYNFKLKNSNAKPFIGLAWEHEFKGESKASISGVGEAPAPSMKGHTGIMEVGCDWKVSKKWTLGLGANAYIGKRKGWDGMARVFYNF